MWYHKTCVTMSTKEYEHLENNSISFLCCRCNHPNYTTNSYSQDIPTDNWYNPLLDVPNDIASEQDMDNFNPRVYSSPKGTTKRRLNSTINDQSTDDNNDTISNEELPPKERHWRSAVVKANSIQGKLAEL